MGRASELRPKVADMLVEEGSIANLARHRGEVKGPNCRILRLHRIPEQAHTNSPFAGVTHVGRWEELLRPCEDILPASPEV